MANAAEIRAMLDRLEGKTVSAKLRELMPEIDRKVRAGVGHEEIVEALNAQGFDLKLTNFRSILYRYRKKNPGNAKHESEQRNGNSVVPVVGATPAANAKAQQEPDAEAMQGVEVTDNVSVDAMLRSSESEAFTEQFMTRKPITRRKP